MSNSAPWQQSPTSSAPAAPTWSPVRHWPAWIIQLSLGVYWHLSPVKPPVQVHLPPVQVPWLLQSSLLPSRQVTAGPPGDDPEMQSSESVLPVGAASLNSEHSLEVEL